ncbi:polysialyltransferase family glycosyltransferase [Aerococcus kribbianus]|uniref:Polysialyltransferase family glycosyltransferase n=1 Tax=Aerococcus kribbianus TaxID=2999064 RepID=A0A9X3JEM2_9LACT|nr:MULTISPECIES: polysialyltransferase family glycosyltransferase [unclassified Aerococcus]MCZ0717304.1 polysialyltransferase family glycosyltransferase [Aerococcus sp. YH-aer221]MCZ0725592.1 polysialyltransferase family glycosyltransferase [Aerococcus sp. YH-aer222]
MKHAFIAWTPLHLINALNIIVNKFDKQETTIFCYDDFSFAPKLIGSLKLEFPEIKVITINNNLFTNKLKKIWHLYKPFKNNHFDCYDHLYIPGDNYFARVLYLQQKHYNSSLQLHYYEDGIGAYIGADILRLENKNDKWQKYYVKNSIFHAKWGKGYYYKPSLVAETFCSELQEIPSFTEENPAYAGIMRLFKRAYQENYNDSDEMELIYFDQPFLNDNVAIDEVKVFQQLNTLCQSQQMNLKVKCHPRSDANKYGQAQLVETNLPWEIFVQLVDIEKLVIFSVNSTAGLSPLIMSGQEGRVIYLPKYIQNLYAFKSDSKEYAILKNSEELFSRFADEGKLAITLPSTDQEIKRLLQQMV